MSASIFGKTDDALVITVSNFSTIPNFIVDYITPPTKTAMAGNSTVQHGPTSLSLKLTFQ